jgi:hypothetical protein
MYKRQWDMSHRFADSLRAGLGWNCPKHVEFYPKNKFEKLVHLGGFNIRVSNLFRLASIRNQELGDKNAD